MSERGDGAGADPMRPARPTVEFDRDAPVLTRDAARALLGLLSRHVPDVPDVPDVGGSAAEKR
jgi:hypothetical protein